MMETMHSGRGGGACAYATSHSLLEMDEEMRIALDRNDVDFQDKAHLYQQVLWPRTRGREKMADG